MGKYMRKSKASGEVAVMEVGGALLGVRTRSRTLLALQQRASSPSPSPQRKGSEDRGAGAAGDFLELRSRRLEKQPPPPPPGHKEKDAFHASRSSSAQKEAAEEGFEADDLEASFGDNVLDWDAIERSTRETTPCSLIRSSETMSTPGSATRTSNRRTTQAPTCRYIPSSLEMDEFFDAAERQQQQAFRDKYNFCPASECPLPGRFEWARIDC
ncbi:unnamed protein product [Alopecurus aequalis]